MTSRKLNYSDAVESRFPGLVAEVRRVIQESENKYEGKSGNTESFLWQHTTHVTTIAFQLALAEGLDPVMPAIAALFHDAGKFAAGHYHEDDKAEELEAIQIAEPMLRQFGLKAKDISRVISGLNLLYSDANAKNSITRIVHDADFLSKFGAMGVASFFVKSALRGRTLGSAILGHLSKELTYAACLPLNMRTVSARKLAVKKATDSLRFFRQLLGELRDAGIADLRIRRMRIPHPVHKKRFLEVSLVASPSCPRCGSRWRTAWEIAKGIKCWKLTVEWICGSCSERHDTSFCLPEVTR